MARVLTIRTSVLPPAFAGERPGRGRGGAADLGDAAAAPGDGDPRRPAAGRPEGEAGDSPAARHRGVQPARWRVSTKPRARRERRNLGFEVDLRMPAIHPDSEVAQRGRSSRGTASDAD